MRSCRVKKPGPSAISVPTILLLPPLSAIMPSFSLCYSLDCRPLMGASIATSTEVGAHSSACVAPLRERVWNFWRYQAPVTRPRLQSLSRESTYAALQILQVTSKPAYPVFLGQSPSS